MSKHQTLDQYCAHKGQPIRLGEPHSIPFNCKPMDDAWLARTRENWWGQSGNSAEVEADLCRLRDALIALGGQAACLPSIDDDLQKILERGQLWPGTGAIMNKGQASRCHSNSVLCWEANQHLDMFVATGYALSDDGMWRQHSWCVMKKPRSLKIVETTVARELYFGFIMDLEETLDFADQNTDLGVEATQKTEERYRLLVPSPASKARP